MYYAGGLNAIVVGFYCISRSAHSYDKGLLLQPTNDSIEADSVTCITRREEMRTRRDAADSSGASDEVR